MMNIQNTVKDQRAEAEEKKTIKTKKIRKKKKKKKIIRKRLNLLYLKKQVKKEEQ